jgi:prepilin-type N-terminal cleavage/methylation domain-containing protein
MKTVKKQAFNLIEILIALGILAIGMVAVLGLFPLGFATTRDAMAESSSADAADQMLHMLQFKLKDQTVWTNIIVNHQIPSTKPVANWNTGLPDSDTAWARIEPFTAGCVLKKETSAGVYTPGLYKIIRFADKTPEETIPAGNAAEGEPYYNSTADIIDFEAIAVVWKEPFWVDLNNDGIHQVSEDLGYDRAVVLNVEICWPANLPDISKRKRALYRLELFNNEKP